MAKRASLSIPEPAVREYLADTNPWWIGGRGLEPDVTAWPHRAYFKAFWHLVAASEVRRAVVLIGPRRVGKTIMLLQTIARLLAQGVPGNRIMLAPMDVPAFAGQSLDSLTRLFMQIHLHRVGSDQPPLYVLFDEVQYLPDWPAHLKVLVDQHPHVRFVATGSAAAALRQGSVESGAGRFTDFVLPPLTFAEYLDFCGQSGLLVDQAPAHAARTRWGTPNVGELNREFLNYLNYGGFPEAVMNRAVREDPRRFLRQDIIDKVLQKDLPSLFGISNTLELNRFFNVLAFNSGMEVSPANLAETTGLSKVRVEEYLSYLEAAFLVRRLPRVAENARRMQRATSFKVYLTNPSVRAALFGIVREGDPALGHLVETAIVSQWLHSPEAMAALHYARWREGGSDHEVDLVGLKASTQKPNFAVEIKWTDRPAQDLRELKSLQRFLAVHHTGLARPALVTTRTHQGPAQLGEHPIEFVPAALHCATIGRNLTSHLEWVPEDFS